MDKIAFNVFRRFLSATIPDRWIKAKKQELAAILKAPLGRTRPDDIASAIDDKLMPFFKRFEKEFQDQVNYMPVEESVKNRVDMMMTYLTKAASQMWSLSNATKVPHANNAKDHLIWIAHVEAISAFEDTVKTLGDVLRYSWSYDKAAEEAIASKAMKKLTPELKAAFDDTESYDNRNSRLRFDFLVSIGFYNAAKKLIKKERATLDFTKWVDRIIAMLQANYSQEAADNLGLVPYHEFDLYGMKVIIDDRTVTPEQAKHYVGYLDETYQRMKSKGFGMMWYGKIFIQCESCGGSNPNGADFGVGGDYSIGRDDIRIYERPSAHNVKLLAHELAHRYWFKHMSGSQRAKFESLVKVKSTTEEKPVLPVSEYGGSNTDEAFAEVVAYFVIGRDMTRDQYESMRSVLSSRNTQHARPHPR